MKTLLSLLVTFLLVKINAQEATTKQKFKSVVDLPVTSVKSQDRTGTCWSFATTSYIESEILRMGGPELNLSEMYFVRYTYPEKAKQYVMRHGLGNFSEGGQAHDVMNVVKKYGFVTEDVFPGKRDETKPHNHSELASVQKAALDNLLNKKGASPSYQWYEIIESILNIYMGDLPQQVMYDGKTMSPMEFRDVMEINPDDYVELTSYLHHPWYSYFNLEIPDNWSFDLYYNLPVDELMEVMNSALKSGYTICWDGDVSNKHFSNGQGVATLPDNNDPGVEKEVTQKMRQEAFLSWQTTDDHLMHITGIAKNSDNTIFYKTKNSWGDGNLYGGYLYMSESYVKLNTIAFMVHKDAIPKKIADKIFKLSSH